MVIGRRIAAFNFRELFVLCKVFLKSPLYLHPTYKATKITVAISNRLYGKLHHKNNRTNAFRHALWNYLICKYCLQVARTPENAMNWSKKITDLHERLSPNDGLEKMMDLHNNKIGRELFLDADVNEEDITSILKQITSEAVKVSSLAEIQEVKKNLVFIEKLKTPL
ncbi:DUF6973 domain-containing protein [Salinimicrobium terrae]|uniref:DUF6973 domain-containing protein n=1 Tax=Salinimicrobium terrae TaxID=470866 RepID=UPI00048F9877|nr:hypothetical protein [Salinimicrobium terrae]